MNHQCAGLGAHFTSANRNPSTQPRAIQVADEVIRTRRLNATHEARADQLHRTADLEDMLDQYVMQAGHDDPFEEIFDPPFGGTA